MKSKRPKNTKPYFFVTLPAHSLLASHPSGGIAKAAAELALTRSNNPRSRFRNPSALLGMQAMCRKRYKNVHINEAFGRTDAALQMRIPVTKKKLFNVKSTRRISLSTKHAALNAPTSTWDKVRLCREVALKEIEMIEILNESNFDEKVLQGKGEILVELFATWCPHCQRMAPIVDELAGDVAGRVTVYRVDVDQSPDLAEKYAPEGYPTFAVFEDGQEIRSASGERSMDELLELIN